MRCQSCDCNLTDQESVRKSINTGEYLDLCNSCLAETDIVVTEINYLDEVEEDEYIP